jgi:hypothetical protein
LFGNGAFLCGWGFAGDAFLAGGFFLAVGFLGCFDAFR